MQKEEHQVREKEIQGHELERTRGASTETDRRQGGFCTRKHPERTATCESQVQRRVRKHMGYKRALFPKAPEGRTLSNGERSEQREARRFL